MPRLTSADGTTISYDVLSQAGPTLVLIGGGLDDGSENIPLAEWLTRDFTVVNYRRRGRGDSTDTAPYAVQREVEDLRALIEVTGGRAHVFAASSGGALALEAAASGVPIDRLTAHEVPYQIGAEQVAAWRHYRSELTDALEANDPDEALRLFMRLAGSSEDDITAAQAAPVWPSLRFLAPTLDHDAACIGDGPPPADRLARVTQPVLLTTGATVDPHSAELPLDFFSAAAEAAVACLPDAQHVQIDVSGHVADPAALGPVLSRFYRGEAPTSRRST